MIHMLPPEELFHCFCVFWTFAGFCHIFMAWSMVGSKVMWLDALLLSLKYYSRFKCHRHRLFHRVPINGWNLNFLILHPTKVNFFEYLQSSQVFMLALLLPTTPQHPPFVLLLMTTFNGLETLTNSDVSHPWVIPVFMDIYINVERFLFIYSFIVTDNCDGLKDKCKLAPSVCPTCLLRDLAYNLATQ